MNFLEKLDYMMNKMSINKSKLSAMSGVPYTTIDGFYKKGYANTKMSTIRKIAAALDVSLDYLIDDNITDEYFRFTISDTDPQIDELNRNAQRLNAPALQKLVDYSEDLIMNPANLKKTPGESSASDGQSGIDKMA
ncbi:MAG: helix-turn-helix transcriptional regulator [Clostridiales bacterium]|nr:helix-turn-helix transcriptional regulator [Clostridiales bacterium]